MENLKLFLTTFIVIYLFYLVFVVLSKKRVATFYNNSYVKFLKNVYNVDVYSISNKTLANIVSLSNSFIIALTLVIVDITDEFYLKILLAFAILIPLQLIIYYVIGKVLNRKSDKNV